MILIIKHCPTCDRSSDKVRFIGEFCEVCTAEKLLKKTPDKAEVIHCRRCGRVRGPAGYQESSNELIETVLSKELCNSKCKVKIEKISEDSALLKITAPVGNESVTFEKGIELKMEHQICQDCYRKSSGYYEALVQLRGNKERVARMEQKLIKFITMRNGFIAKTEQVENGLDIYTSDRLMTKNFFYINRLVPKASFTLYGIKDGKKVYRHTYYLNVDE